MNETATQAQQRQLNELMAAAEAFRVVMVEHALNMLAQDIYFPQLRALEAALNPSNYQGDPEKYLIWSNEHQAWWRPNSQGYTVHLEAAGRYDSGEAIEIASTGRDGWFEGEPPPEIAISESDVLAHKRQPERLIRRDARR